MRRGRHGTALAVALCLGGALTACGGSGDGYVAVGGAGSTPEGAPTAAVPPKGKVELVPLDGTTASEGSDASGDSGGRTPGKPRTSDGGGLPAVPSGGDADSGSGEGGGSTTGSSGGAGSTGSPGGPAPEKPAPAPGTTPDPGPTPQPTPTPKPTPKPKPKPTPPPPGPAVLALGEPVRAALDERWCEKVTVEFRNTGGSAVASGTVTFATHIIGLLGTDWATVESAQPLPAPIAARSTRKQAYTVCVDAWRVPLGMHIETQDVTAVWK
ncbi:hypothetical protein AB0M39_37000 [Streptomyces sp. NPDC051907]|uniref:hypothetical protein n=1 Tax=Streptomyces sp. NPDC051907 TaxID=3155284 RepID=UPI00344446C4